MTWDQLQGWSEYYSVEPFGEERADLRLGIMASLFANANRDPDKTPPFEASDFIPDFAGWLDDKPSKPQPKGQSWEQIKEMARAFAGKPQS